MKVACVGLDPAGLYLGILLKRRDPAHAVRFIEGAEPDAGPAPILCNPLRPRLALDDAQTLEELDQELAYFDTVAVKTKDRAFETKGLRYAAIDRAALVGILKRRAARLGCEFERAPGIFSPDQIADADLIVVADGAASRLRERAAGLATTLAESRTRLIAFESQKRSDALTYTFRDTPGGVFHAFAYPRGRAGSCIVVEAPAEAVRASGMERATAAQALAFCRELFPEALDGATPLEHETGWRPFLTVRNRPWHAGNVVLLGQAAYTSHVSVGLDVRSALEDAEALADQLGSGAGMADALKAYEAARRPKAESLQRAAQASLNWFETVSRSIRKPFEQFVFSLLTSSMRMTYARIDKVAPDLVRAVDGLIAGAAPGANRPPPPMFAPITLRELTIPNRIVVSPMCMYSAKDGTVNDFHLVHLGSRAVGGAGLVLTEMTDVLPEGRISLHCAGMYSPEHVAAWERVVTFVHQHSNAKIGIQLAHAGRKGSLTRSWEGHESLGEAKWDIVAPSPLPFAQGRQVPKEMTRADMDMVRDAFVRATKMTDAAGFDMIELHFAHGYLISSFISPLSNQRRDDYGGSLANRMRFPLEIFSAVRAAWPAHKPISTRISSVDWVEGGNGIEEGVEIGRMLHDAGNDILAVSSGGVSSEQARVDGRAYQAAFSDRIRNELAIPTMAVGGIVSHGDANTILAAGRADMCALARGYLEDPYFVRHAAREQNYGGHHWPSQYRRAGEVRLRGE
ncbi:MAG: anthraniloyl-CoA monooxygenase [Alphaproteobacteria bacterium]|nr:anthraniloyl-CoA monooxygenase [Alphaproteobacteria bacterium]